MNKESFNALKKMITQDGFFEALVSGVDDWDEALDKRDEPGFDQAWSSSYEALKGLAYPSAEDEVAVTEIREFVFKKVFSIVHDSEVSGYISDDIGLIADSALKSTTIEWVDELRASYVSKRFPR